MKEFIQRRESAQRLFSIAPDGSDTREHQRTELSQLTRDRGLSPDGKWMAYSKQVDGVTGLYVQVYPSGPERRIDPVTRTP